MSRAPSVPAGVVGPRRRAWRLVAALIVLAVVGAGAWWGGSRVRSPREAAADAAPPAASWVTSPVESRVLASTVVGRGDVVPRVSTAVAPPTAVVSGAVVTGLSVAPGDEVGDGARVAEVSGRPVFVFEGSVPVFREMRPGMRGADIAALQAALVRWGCPADQDAGFYGEPTKWCVASFYQQAGYDWVPTSPTEAATLAAARQAATDAQASLDSALQVLTAAQVGPADSERVAAQAAVDGARRRLREAEAGAGASVADANDALRVAEVQLAEVLAPPDVTAEFLAVGQATTARDRANEALVALEATTGPTVPQGEVVFVPSVPATVDELTASLGPLADASASASGGPAGGSGGGSGELMVLSSGGLEVRANVAPNDALTLSVGMDVELLDETSGETVTGRVAELADEATTGPSGESTVPVVIEGEVPAGWSGRNVRVTFTAAATDGPVLVVPLAAVSSSADGSTRVQVLGADGAPVDVPVVAGLSADGFVEITPRDAEGLEAGDQVVVGR